MIFLNSQKRYGIVAIIFHWFMAVLLIALIALGLYMTPLHISVQKLRLYGWHKEWGILALALVLMRVLWRITNITPKFPLNMPLWERYAARLMHWFFYFLMFAIPLSGWLVTSSSGLPVSFFNLFILPDLIAPNEKLRLFFTEMHEILSYTLIACICVHVLAAFKHQFINKDGILRRIV